MTTAMKALVTTALCVISFNGRLVGAVGSVFFANRPPGSLDAPFYDQDGGFLSGPEYVAQLYAWKEDKGFVPICFPVAFVSDGYLPSHIMIIPFVDEGYPAWIQVRAWEMASGATFDEAVLAGAWSGTSEVVYVPFLGSPGRPCPEGSTKSSLESFMEQVTPLDVPWFPAKLDLKYPGPPLVVRQPVAQTVRAREQVQLSVVASSGVQADYQWHQSPSDAPYGLIPWATNATYTTPALSSTTTYWVTIRNSAGTTTSDEAIITVLPWLSISALAQDGVELRLEGAPETEYEIQSTDSLNAAGWLSLTNVTVPWWGWKAIQDNSITGASTRFYRAVALP